MFANWQQCNGRPQSGSQLEVKVDTVYSLLSMLNHSNRVEMTDTLHQMSINAGICQDMRQYGCLPLLVQLIHPLDGYDVDCDSKKQEESKEVRTKASEALRNIVRATDDKREMRVLRLLDEIRSFSDLLRDIGWTTEEEVFKSSHQHPGPAISSLMKFSFDEKHRQAICELGGLQAIAELLHCDCEYHGNTVNTQCITIRRYASMALTNLTFGDEKNKILLCSMKYFMRALVQQLYSPSEELRQVTASVLRNLSWRADKMSKQTLREVGVVITLMKAALEATKESTLKSILSALWNLSAHSVANKADICSVDGALEFLVSCLSYKSVNNTLAVVENGGGILRNISSHIAVNEEYRVILREHNCLPILLEQLKSPSLTVVSNACGTLWNLSARCPQDQKTLWELGAVGMLKNLVHSKHKMISIGSKAALKNLLSVDIPGFTPNIIEGLTKDSDSVPSLPARKLKAFKAELDENIAETCDNLESPKSSPTHNPASIPIGHHLIGKHSASPFQYLPYRMYTSFSGNLCSGIISRSSSKDSIGSTHSEPLNMYRVHGPKYPQRPFYNYNYNANNSHLYWAYPIKTYDETFFNPLSHLNNNCSLPKNSGLSANPIKSPEFSNRDLPSNYSNDEESDEKLDTLTLDLAENKEALHFVLPDLIEDTKKSPERDERRHDVISEVEESESISESGNEAKSSSTKGEISSSIAEDSADLTFSSYREVSENERSSEILKEESSSNTSNLEQLSSPSKDTKESFSERSEPFIVQDYEFNKLDSEINEVDEDISKIEENSKDVETVTITDILITNTENNEVILNNANNNYSTSEISVDKSCENGKSITDEAINLLKSIASDLTESSCISDIDNVKPPSMMDEVSMSLESSSCLTDSMTSKPNNIRFKSHKSKRIPISKRTINSKANRSISSNELLLDYTKPPSLMEDISGLSSSCGSLNSLGSDIYDSPINYIKKLNEDATAIVQQYTKEINQLTASYNSTSCDSEILEKIKPPKVFREIASTVDTTFVVTQNCDVSDTEDIEDLPRDSKDESTLVPEHTSFNISSIPTSGQDTLQSPLQCPDSEIFNDNDKPTNFVDYVVQENAKLAAHVFNEMAAIACNSCTTSDDIYLENENISLISTTSDDDSKATYTCSPRKARIIKPVARNMCRKEESIAKKVTINNMRKSQLSNQKSLTAPSSPLNSNKVSVKGTKTSALRAARSKSAEASNESMPQKGLNRNTSEKKNLNNQAKCYHTKTFVIRKKAYSSPSVTSSDKINQNISQTQMAKDAKSKTTKLNEKNNNCISISNNEISSLSKKRETQSKIAALWKRNKNKDTNKTIIAFENNKSTLLMKASSNCSLTRSSTYEKLPQSAEEALRLGKTSAKSKSLSKVRPTDSVVASDPKKKFSFISSDEKLKAIPRLSNNLGAFKKPNAVSLS
ncbi:adenomatous polyposis coli protein-like protein [Dinothrombium tinctorium]|uniref:Adenomatous polyposis coli protein-like protein n=1 Tax=Dinothrombium tinctorium TaxID=1965070 RepID=A0A443RK68_9ACAR|nr:adenomatous polyposis coli protein-like protein [Dinothrombium tinctorium]